MMSRRELIATSALAFAGRAAARPDKPDFYLGATSYLVTKAAPDRRAGCGGKVRRAG